MKVKTLRKHPDYELALGPHPARELIIITVHVTGARQHKTTVAVRDECIGRILFGSNPAWHARRLEERMGKSGKISAPGFGCLDLTTCRIARDGADRNLWDNFMYTPTRNGEFHEMIGRSADELDRILFADSAFYRSFIGRNATYFEAVAHWIDKVGRIKIGESLRETKRESALTDPTTSADLTEDYINSINLKLAEMRDNMEKSVREAYRRALAPYIETVLKALISSAPLGTSGQTGDKDSTNYIRVLQEGHGFYGHIYRTQDSEEHNTSKLVYEIADTLYLAVTDIGAYKMVDGGIYLCCKKDKVVPKAAHDIILKHATSRVSQVELQKAYEVIVSSAFCPYGYMAHALQKITDFSDNHLDFFLATKVDNHYPSETKMIDPRNCVSSHTTLQPKPDKKDTIHATSIKYFTDLDDKGRNDKLFYLRFLKELWTKYIYTWPYIHSLIEMYSEVKGTASEQQRSAKRNRERVFAFVLARFLRTTPAAIQELALDTDTPNIYELMPYGRFGQTKRVVDDEFVHSMETKYRTVFRNFFTNSDEAYRHERMWCMRECEKILDAGLLREDEFTNLDFVHGYLLADNFVVDPANGYPGYMNWKQYIAMSSSVVYAREGVNESMTFLQGAFAAARGGTKLVFSKSGGATPGSRFLQKDSIMTVDGEEDVMRLFNNQEKVDTAVLVNIANVPIYNEGKQLGNNIMVSTLNEALSSGNNFVYLLARSLHVRSEKSVYEFDFVSGRPPLPPSNAINLSATAEFRHTESIRNAVHTWGAIDLRSSVGRPTAGAPSAGQGAPAEFMYANGGPGVMLATRGVANRAVVAPGIQHRVVDIVTEVRNVLDNLAQTDQDGRTRVRYLSKPECSALLIDLAAHGRNTLSKLPPGPHRGSYRETLSETVASYRTQVIPVISLTRGVRGDSVRAEDYSIADMENYMQSLLR
jgi:hypothetical protein